MPFLRSRVLMLTAVLSLAAAFPFPAQAAGIPSGDFSIEVSPSPLFATVEPGKSSTLELKIRNASLQSENLKIETRDFTIAKDSQTIQLSNSAPQNLSEWVKFQEPIFTVASGQWYTQKITVTVPQEAGFSYPFALVISRAKETSTDPTNGRLLRGSVAVFTLLNINKPGATRKLQLDSLTTSQPVYEYLPATIKLRLKNVGNSIVQPYGNFYIQRDANSEKPLAVLPVNDTLSYLLPNTTREITAEWKDGFPLHKIENGAESVDWSSHKPGDFRFGRYTARVVAVYNDGTRDVPIITDVTFWVIPWKILLGLLIGLVLVGIGLRTTISNIIRKLKKLCASKQQ